MGFEWNFLKSRAEGARQRIDNLEVRDTGLGSIGSMELCVADFVKSYCLNIYKTILEDCYSYSIGLDKKYKRLIIGNYSTDESKISLIDIIANGMYSMSVIRLVYKDGLIYADCSKFSDKEIVAFDFSRFEKTKILKLYIRYFYNLLQGLNGMLVSNTALQYKASNLRELVSKQDSICESDNRKHKCWQSGIDGCRRQDRNARSRIERIFGRCEYNKRIYSRIIRISIFVYKRQIDERSI
ncbi:MAG: hypothetical protein LBF97_07585 [Elusimicrobiota bacterium]|nr:hypothetical protein [Elusimicrobiota bacterium]